MKLKSDIEVKQSFKDKKTNLSESKYKNVNVYTW